MTLNLRVTAILPAKAEGNVLLRKEQYEATGTAIAAHVISNYRWQSRQPRVKNDITNTLMDIGYTIFFNMMNDLLEMYGFDVYADILHTQFFHRKSLVCDLEAPFRSIIAQAIVKR